MPAVRGDPARVAEAAARVVSSWILPVATVLRHLEYV
jgi:hypothetical protein